MEQGQRPRKHGFRGQMAVYMGKEQCEGEGEVLDIGQEGREYMFLSMEALPTIYPLYINHLPFV